MNLTGGPVTLLMTLYSIRGGIATERVYPHPCLTRNWISSDNGISWEGLKGNRRICMGSCFGLFIAWIYCYGHPIRYIFGLCVCLDRHIIHLSMTHTHNPVTGTAEPVI